MLIVQLNISIDSSIFVKWQQAGCIQGMFKLNWLKGQQHFLGLHLSAQTVCVLMFSDIHLNGILSNKIPTSVCRSTDPVTLGHSETLPGTVIVGTTF